MTNPDPAGLSLHWLVYIIECSDGSLYTGITNNLSKRFHQHCVGKGAKYFFSRQPLRVVYVEEGHDRRSASAREYALKQLNREEKLSLIAVNLDNCSKSIGLIETICLKTTDRKA